MKIFIVVYLIGLLITTIDQILMERRNRINNGRVCIPAWKLSLGIILWPVYMVYCFVMSLIPGTGFGYVSPRKLLNGYLGK